MLLYVFRYFSLPFFIISLQFFIQSCCLEVWFLSLCLVLSSRQSPLIICNPETSSRVTLATLGIGFQPNLSVLLFGCLVVWLLNWQFLMFVNTFSCTFSEKYFLSFVIPPFHLCVVIALIVNRLDEVELRVEYGWNYMKFHP